MTILFMSLAVIAMLIFILLTAIRDERRKRREAEVTAKLDSFWAEKERRKEVRIEAALKIRYKLGKSLKIKQDCSMGNDISKSGIGIILNEKFNEGSLLVFEIELPDTSNPICATGKIMWVKESSPDKDGRRNFCAGLQFMETCGRDKERLEKYIKDAGALQSI